MELSNLRHIPVPIVDIEPPSLHLPLDPLQLQHLRVVCVSLPSPAVVRRGAVVVMSPRLGVPSVVVAVVVVVLGVAIVTRLIAAPEVKIFSSCLC